jgi:GH25 family lysozyme M1 (1,4-beta-N-acetylmuramidase)
MGATGSAGFVHATCPRVAARLRSLASVTAITGLTVCLLASSAPAEAAVAASAAPVSPAGAAARGFDVSAFQHAHGAVINWSGLAHHGIRFVGIKVSEGNYYTNPYYASDAQDAHAVGITVLPYVFANPQRAGGAATAAYAIGASSYHRNSKTLPLAVDLENDPYQAKKRPGNCYGLRVPQMIAWITAFTSETSRLTGVRPVIYTTADWWRQCTRNTTLFQHDPLWVAAYGVHTPAVPGPWGRWTFWQYTDAGVLPGVGVTDLDYLSPGMALSMKRAPAHRTAKHRPAKHRPAKHRPAKRSAAKKATSKRHAAKQRPAKQRPAKHRPAKHRPAKRRVAKQRSAKHQVSKRAPSRKRGAKQRPRRSAGHHAAQPRTSYHLG